LSLMLPHSKFNKLLKLLLSLSNKSNQKYQQSL